MLMGEVLVLQESKSSLESDVKNNGWININAYLTLKNGFFLRMFLCHVILEVHRMMSFKQAVIKWTS